jgi:hypothetical protein
LIQRLTLKLNEALSNIAVKFKLRRSTEGRRFRGAGTVIRQTSGLTDIAHHAIQRMVIPRFLA